MGKLKNKNTDISNPFDSTVHNTEWTCAALVANWINDIVKEENIPVGTATVEQRNKASGKRADISIQVSPRNEKLLCLIECKIPQWDVFNFDLKEDARKKALKRGAPYFATCNFRKLVLWNTEKAGNPTLNETEQIVNKYELSEIYDIDEIETYRFGENIKKGLADFLKQLYGIHTGNIPEPKHPLDEYLIFRLHEKIRILTYHYTRIIYDTCHKDTKFAKSLQKWFNEQGWEFPYPNVTENDYRKAARQTAYLLVNKILFYDVLQSKRPKQLDPLEIPKGLSKGSMLKKTLQNFFDEVLKIDYEIIFETDFIDEIAFPDEEAVVEQVKELVGFLQQYDLSKIDYDIIGRVFERLIPQDERHALGQYFTNTDVVDLILGFCIQHETDKVLDPSCGTGTFLVRSYHYKKLLNQRIKHEELLNSIWGNDIAKFPSHLATINLAIRDLSSDSNYPNILKEDFFALHVGNEGFDNELWRKRRASTLGKDIRDITYPRWFDAIVGNPPYTRQEEIPDIGVNKAGLIERALLYNGKPLAKLSKRAGIHAYFFVHAGKFLKEGGHLGFIVSNSWMDADYGAGLQEYFFKNFKIVAIIESKMERWFEEADVNTGIVILKKCSDKAERMQNLARFVQLKKPLRHFIPAAENEWSRQLNRKNEIDKLIQTILAHNDYYENDDLRVFPISQQQLWDEGCEKTEYGNKAEEEQTVYSKKKSESLFQTQIREPSGEYRKKSVDTEQDENKFSGNKLGKYVRAPQIFFKILEKGKDKIVNLKEIASPKAGCYTGINEFFYFDKRPDLKDKVEKDFLIPIIRNPRQVNTILLENKKNETAVFVCSLSKKELKKNNFPGALNYINWGETQTTRERQKRDAGVPYPDVETVKTREPGWWSIPENNVKPTNLFMQYVINKRFVAPYSHSKICSDRCFHRLFLTDDKNLEIVAALLNSIFTVFCIELIGRSNLGLGALKFEASDAEKILIINPNKISAKHKKALISSIAKIGLNPAQDIFEQIGTSNIEEVDLNKINIDKRALDKIVLGEILGLTEKQQLEVYKAVIDLVKNRLDKAKSIGKQHQIKDGLDVTAFMEMALGRLGDVKLSDVYKEKVLSQKNLKHVKLLPKASPLQVQQDMFDWKLTSGKKHLIFQTEEEATYCKVFTEAGMDEIVMPELKVIKKLLPELIKVLEKNKKQIKELAEPILNERLREQIENRLWREVM